MDAAYIVTVIIGVSSIVVAVCFLAKARDFRKKEKILRAARMNYTRQIEVLRSQLSERVKSLETMVDNLSLSNKELSRLNDIKSEFMSVVAHDLRQPLTSIQGYTSVLINENSDKDDQKILDNIIKATSNINHLMSDLVDASVLESGKLQVAFKEFNYNQLVEDIFNQFKVIAEQKNINLTKIDYPVPIMLSADKFRINQVLSNILNNAIKFTNEGGNIEIRYIKEGLQLFTMVLDDGIGVSPIERAKVFQKFRQSEYLDSEHKKLGWGLGLSIAEDVIKAHGGIIGVDSAGLKKGSAFWFLLPL